MVSIWKAIVGLCKNQPVLILGVVAAALTLAASFGFNLGDHQQAAIMAFLQILVSLIAKTQTVAKVKYAKLVAAIKQKAAGA